MFLNDDTSLVLAAAFRWGLGSPAVTRHGYATCLALKHVAW